MALAHRPVAGIPLARVRDFHLAVDWSLVVIFALVVVSLGTGALPAWHPWWPASTLWTVAVIAGVLFFVSVLVHELAHAVVGRAFGMDVRGVTLFLFGGVTELQGEPPRPVAELVMALAGPLTSLVIGAVATLLGAALAGPIAGDTTLWLSTLGPGTTLLLWLGPINVALALFNLVPGFPLDGGRALRALLWWVSGDLRRATAAASAGGRAFGILLVAIGVAMALGLWVPVFGTGLIPGLWLVVVGWFLHGAARASYEHVVVREHFAGVHVADLMRAEVVSVPVGTTIGDFVRSFVMAGDPTSFPVVDHDALVGVIASRDVRAVPPEAWATTHVEDVMVAAAGLPVVEAEAPATEALEKLARADVEQIPVLDHGHLRGVVRRQDLLKWLALAPELA